MVPLLFTFKVKFLDTAMFWCKVSACLLLLSLIRSFPVSLASRFTIGLLAPTVSSFRLRNRELLGAGLVLIVIAGLSLTMIPPRVPSVPLTNS